MTDQKKLEQSATYINRRDAWIKPIQSNYTDKHSQALVGAYGEAGYDKGYQQAMQDVEKLIEGCIYSDDYGDKYINPEELKNKLSEAFKGGGA